MTVNNNHRKSGCQFAEETVALLYGEGRSGTKVEFDAHFDNCPSCSEELAAFGFIRSAIQEWRDEAFADLPSPQIVIPGLGERTAATLNNRRANSWFDLIKGLFYERPLFVSASTAFAGLAICLAIVLAIAYNPAFEQIAGTLPIVEVDTADSQIAAQSPAEPETATPQSEKSNVSPSKIAEQGIANNKSERKTTRSANKDSNNRTSRPGGNTSSPNDATIAKDDKTNKKNKTSSPTIDEIIISNFTAEEEDSIRLADLFDEVGSKK